MLILQDRLEEKDSELAWLKQELDQRSILEETTELASNKKVGDEGIMEEEVGNENS